MAEKRKLVNLFSRQHKLGENDTKTQISLDQDSPEYREMIMDRSGMDEFEQEVRVLELTGRRQADDFDPDDKWHEEQQIAAAAVGTTRMATQKAAQDAYYNKVVERKQNRRIMKGLLMDDLEAKAMDQAQTTPTIEDDKAAETIRRRVPHLITDDGVTVDDFIPNGMKYL